MIHSPSLTVVRAGVNEAVEFVFKGVNVQQGDRAKWVWEGSPSCASAFDATAFSTLVATAPSAAVPAYGAPSSAEANVTTRFIFPSSAVGALVLCYSFRYAQQPAHAQGASRAMPTAYLLFPNIRVVAARYDGVLPSATGIGCSSALVVTGAGFLAMASLLGGTGAASASLPVASGTATIAAPSCGFGTVGTVTADVVNDTHLTCTTPSPTAAGAMPMRVDFGALTTRLPNSFPSFTAFDASENVISHLWPAGGAYNLQPTVHMRGSFGRAHGTPLCRFGNWTVPPVVNVTAVNHYHNATQLTCRKPRFPDAVRDAVGAYPVSFSPNGQCWPNSTSATFVTYNSQVDALAMTGAPSTSALSLDVQGQGFVTPALPNAACRFTAMTSGEVVTSGLSALSSTLVRCVSTPASGAADTWKVEILQNGIDPEPSPYPISFTTYDLSAVRVRSLDPAGGPRGSATAVTVHGQGFAQFGNGQFVCRVGGSLDIPAMLLDANRSVCQLPPLGEASSTAVMVSLNNGTAGTFSADVAVFTAYSPPYIASVFPTQGDALGGSTVTIYGLGFTALSPVAAVRAKLLRCKFGRAEAPPVEAVSHTDSQVECVTPWGEGNDQPVRVALNGVDFTSRLHAATGSAEASVEQLPTFNFLGLHPPALLEAYFTPDSTTLMIRFDAQPTNRAGMNGVRACSTVLDDATTSQLKGTAAEDASCYWADDSTLVARVSGRSARRCWPYNVAKGTRSPPISIGKPHSVAQLT